MPATKEQIRQIIADNNLNSVADVYSLLKDSKPRCLYRSGYHVRRLQRYFEHYCRSQ